ncbi:MAG: hypothetical protein PHY82_11850 [Lentisphaeria bacterium]|nr:hypothetical protein [Lentisphaeria bacterium]
MDYSQMDDEQRDRLCSQKFYEAFFEHTIPQAEYWALHKELYPEEYETPEQNQAVAPPVVYKQYGEQPSVPLSSHLFSAPTVGIHSEPTYTIIPSVNLVNYPAQRQLLPNPYPIRIEDAINSLHLDYGCDDYEKMKVIIVINLVELKLMVMSESLKELARFLPIRFSDMTIAQYETLVRQKGCYQESLPLLNFLRQNTEVRNKITPDLLYNCAMKSSSLSIAFNAPLNTLININLSNDLGWNLLHYPFLYYALLNDLIIPNQENLVAKAFSLAPKIGINTDRPFTEIINLDEILYNRKYAYSTTDLIRPQNLLFHNVYGEQNSIRQVLFPFGGIYGTSYLPVTAVSCPGEMPKMMFLPQNNMPLVGLNNLLYRNDRNVLLTPRISTAVNNHLLADTTVLSWWGGVDTVDLVDWSPLAGKTVYFLLFVQDFGGNEDAMLKCWEKTTEKLESINCTVKFIHMKHSPANPNSQYLTDSGFQQSNQNSSNNHLYW